MSGLAARLATLGARLAVPAALAAAAGCSSVPSTGGTAARGQPQVGPASGLPGGAARGARAGYYLDDGPGDAVPTDLASIPDAVPRSDPAHSGANRPYVVFGREYVPQLDLAPPHRERGHASWYGRRFHGRPTSNGERYDMYGMTAAHPTLPIPSYVRVTHLRSGRSVVVRVNDRGPFLNGRVIDLSYAAAWKLGYVDDGVAEVELELLAAPLPAPLLARAAQRPSGAAASRAESAARMPVPAAAVPAATAARAPTAPVAPAVASAVASASPMLAEAAVERLSIETIIEERAGVAMVPRASVAPVAASAAQVAAAGVPATWLQVGAFASRDNAEAARERLQRDLPWLLAQIEVFPQGETWRVQVGPWSSRGDALVVAERIGSATEFRPVPVVR